MKKTILILVSLLASSFVMSAQSDSTSRKNDKLSEIEAMEVPDKKPKSSSSSELFEFKELVYYGYGLNLVNSDIYTNDALHSYDIFFNVLELQVNPWNNLSINLDANLEWKAFASRTEIFSLDEDRDVITLTPEQAGGPFDRFESYVKIFSIDLPLSLEYHKGLFSLRAGAELDFNLSGRTVTNIKLDNHKARDIHKKVVLDKTSYALVASASFAYTGMFVKYYPEYKFTTLGIILGL